ncbi:MAG: dissimilatory sulfite reductase D family protein [Desulforegulaceae bacterium]|nr:dissimilatory sulfite reductase D family protein [Desulforegulaceae bacterium]
MALPDNAKDIIVEELTKKSKSKSKFYFNDLSKMFPGESPRTVKKLVNEMVSEGVLEYWSSGSTTMYGLKGMGDLG